MPVCANIFAVLVFSVSLMSMLGVPISVVVLTAKEITGCGVITDVIKLFMLPVSCVMLHVNTMPLDIFVMDLFVDVIIRIMYICVVRSMAAVGISVCFFGMNLPLVYLIIVAFFVPSVLRLMVSRKVKEVIYSLLVSVLSINCVDCFIMLGGDRQMLIGGVISGFIMGTGGWTCRCYVNV